MSARTWWWLMLALLLGPGAAGAGVIRGVLRVPPMVEHGGGGPGAYPGRAGSLPHVAHLAHGLAVDAVISVEQIPADAESALARGAKVPKLAQKGQRFVPRVLPVAEGSTVEFPNFDPIFHNVFSVSPVKRFDLGKYSRGHSRSVTFPKPGMVQVYCDIHADMAAFVVVLPNHAFTQPDASGVFALPPLQAGRYTIKVWHPDLPPLEEQVEVPVDGQVRIEFDYEGGPDRGVADATRAEEESP